MIIVSVDPSINFCGIAVHHNKELIFTGLIVPDKQLEDFVGKSLSVFTKVRAIYEIYKKQFNDIDKDIRIVCELPQHFGVSGYLARESGSLFKLTFLVGMICSIPNVITVTPNGWKGQMPKEVIHKRLMQDYPEQVTEKMNHNIVDAIGIGAWYITKLEKDKEQNK